jgi:predicted ABC-type ATPase
LQPARRSCGLAKKNLARRESFAVETTLSGNNYLQMMTYARGLENGFDVFLIYIGTESVEINLARIAKRVQSGGHNVPEADVRRRYIRSFRILPIAFRIADSILLFDNSDEVGFRPWAYVAMPCTVGLTLCLYGPLN